MKKEIVIKPDKVLTLTHGDKVEIYVNKNVVEFHFYCDGTGNFFRISKKELMKLLK